MNTVLYIKANSKPEGASRTYKIADEFMKAYQQANPQDQIITLDLYKEGIHFLTEDDLGIMFGPKNEEDKNHQVLKYAYQFAQADKYVFAEPMWNLSVPAIMKAYIDYISVVGITFKYTEQGPVGMLQNKKAINIVTRGGDYSSKPFDAYEMGDLYLKTIMTFYGIKDYTSLAVDNLDVEGQDVEAVLEKAYIKAKEIAKRF